MKRLAFVDHGYHEKTGSAQFFIDIIENFFSIDVYFDQSYQRGSEPDWGRISSEKYDVVLFWQVHWYPDVIDSLQCDHIISVPMFDSANGYGDETFSTFPYYISFSKALHDRLIGLGCNSLHVQYFPNPSDFDFTDYGRRGGLAGFFWERVPDITWQTVHALLSPEQFSYFHLHKAADPHHTYSLDQLPCLDQIVFSSSEWFADKTSYLAKLAESDVFFAPRIAEGIGFSFLEAMAMGKCVVAHDSPTMNEYIRHGENGLLYNYLSPQKLDFSNARQLGMQARRSVEDGFATWQKQQGEILSVMGVSREKDCPSSSIVHPDLPVVSIVTFTSKSERDCLQTIESVLWQSAQNIELVVVDTIGIFSAFFAEQLASFPAFQGNIKRCSASPEDSFYELVAKGVEQATGDWFFFIREGDTLASDDIILKLSMKLHDNCDLVYGDVIAQDDNGSMVEKSCSLMKFHEIYGVLLPTNKVFFPNSSTLFFKRASLVQYGFDGSSLQEATDEFLSRACCRGDSFLKIDYPIAVTSRAEAEREPVSSYLAEIMRHHIPADAFLSPRVEARKGVLCCPFIQVGVDSAGQENYCLPAVTVGESFEKISEGRWLCRQTQVGNESFLRAVYKVADSQASELVFGLTLEVDSVVDIRLKLLFDGQPASAVDCLETQLFPHQMRTLQLKQVMSIPVNQFALHLELLHIAGRADVSVAVEEFFLNESLDSLRQRFVGDNEFICLAHANRLYRQGKYGLALAIYLMLAQRRSLKLYSDNALMCAQKMGIASGLGIEALRARFVAGSAKKFGVRS